MSWGVCSRNMMSLDVRYGAKVYMRVRFTVLEFYKVLARCSNTF